MAVDVRPLIHDAERQVPLHYGYYNFVKRNGAIRCTPAMEAGVTDSAWTVADLAEMIEG